MKVSVPSSYLGHESAKMLAVGNGDVSTGPARAPDIGPLWDDGCSCGRVLKVESETFWVLISARCKTRRVVAMDAARCTLAVTMASSGQAFREFEQAGWESASVVAKYHEHISAVTTQSVEALLDAAGISSGSRVLDVATGAGYIAGAAAQRGADAIGIDFSAAQVQMARDRYPSLRFEQADAEALPFDSQSFDAVVNGFGMCHFPNPDIALREAFRVLKAGGRIAFTVWDIPERAVGFGAVYAAVRAHGSVGVGPPAGPNFFLLSDPERGTKALLTAGFVSPSCRQVPQVWRLSDPDEVFQSLVEGTVRAAATIRAQSPPAREAIRAAIRNAVAGYRRGDSYEVPMSAALATAVKP